MAAFGGLEDKGYCLVEGTVNGEPTLVIVDHENREDPIFVAVTKGMKIESAYGEVTVARNINSDPASDQPTL